MKNNLKSLDGWINKEGTFFSCKRWRHITIVPHQKVREGWLKISSYAGGHLYCDYMPTQAQINTYWDWCECNDKMDMWNDFQKRWLE